MANWDPLAYFMYRMTENPAKKIFQKLYFFL